LMHRVTDFFDAYAVLPHFGLWHFPTFNVADIGIDGGVALLALIYLFSPSKPTSKVGVQEHSTPAQGESPEA
jgi:lipoprotein signal peptidase